MRIWELEPHAVSRTKLNLKSPPAGLGFVISGFGDSGSSLCQEILGQTCRDSKQSSIKGL